MAFFLLVLVQLLFFFDDHHCHELIRSYVIEAKRDAHFQQGLFVERALQNLPGRGIVRGIQPGQRTPAAADPGVRGIVTKVDIAEIVLAQLLAHDKAE
jgi:hypothetical protein